MLKYKIFSKTFANFRERAEREGSKGARYLILWWRWAPSQALGSCFFTYDLSLVPPLPLQALCLRGGAPGSMHNAENWKTTDAFHSLFPPILCSSHMDFTFCSLKVLQGSSPHLIQFPVYLSSQKGFPWQLYSLHCFPWHCFLKLCKFPWSDIWYIYLCLSLLCIPPLGCMPNREGIASFWFIHCPTPSGCNST